MQYCNKCEKTLANSKFNREKKVCMKCRNAIWQAGLPARVKKKKLDKIAAATRKRDWTFVPPAESLLPLK